LDSTSKALIQGYLENQALLLMEGQKAESHKGVLTLFALLFVKTGRFERKYGKILADLKDDRESGDYEVLSYTDEESAREALLQAKEFVLAERPEYLFLAAAKVAGIHANNTCPAERHNPHAL